MTDNTRGNQKNNSRIVLSVDAMGGDLGPPAVVAGVARSVINNPNLFFILHGPENILMRLVNRRRRLRNCVKIVNSTDVISMSDKPSQVVRSGKNSSMWSALEYVKNGEADVCVSCGNTGALMAISMIRLRKLKGINRPAIAVLWPSKSKVGFNIVLDVGADIKAEANDLLQYALMGVSYARNGLNVKKPKVGLLNVGTEDTKAELNCIRRMNLSNKIVTHLPFHLLVLLRAVISLLIKLMLL